jgi:tetratricopeptide (TPR) repeat protein
MKGKPGKGHQGGYVKICIYCFVEYTIDLPKCSHCGRDTITEEERMIILKEKLAIHKQKEIDRKYKKAKWENYIKTQAMFYKKTSTNYKKWDYFEPDSDSDKEEKEPIVPKDDPQFKAMEADINDRKKRRKRDLKEAMVFKDEGNRMMKLGLYKSAIKYYTDAWELKKDLMPIYTNRALAKNKIQDFQGAIDDCTKLLEYCECFEDGFD